MFSTDRESDSTSYFGLADANGHDVPSRMKLILVTGGVISGVGKGIISSSLGVLLKAHGYRVSAIKIDPYINIDAGTFSPFEHGEVFVLDDGGEVDLDLGNYERFLDVRLTRDHNITTGKIYQQVIERERRGDYLGKTVQVVPHITDAISAWVERVSEMPIDGTNQRPDVCIVELGGTIGDIEGMAFVDAFKRFQTPAFRDDFMSVHVSLVVFPRATGEPKTKPTQNSIRDLRQSGLVPDLLICRSELPVDTKLRMKICSACTFDPEQVLGVSDVSNIYKVPLLLHDQCVMKLITERLKLPPPKIGISHPLAQWTQLSEMFESAQEEVNIALVGKYVPLSDAYASVRKALQHSAMHARRNLVVTDVDSECLQEDADLVAHAEAWEKLKKADGILVPGGFGERGIEGMIEACRYARENNIPFLGVCLGMQCAVIEFARNVCNIEGANSTEFNKLLELDQQVVIDMPEHDASKLGMGATMRLGLRDTVFLTERCKLRRLYGKSRVSERHRHRYEVNPKCVSQLCEKGLYFVGTGTDKNNGGDACAQRARSASALISLAKANGNRGPTGSDLFEVDEKDHKELMTKVNDLCTRGTGGTIGTAVRMEMVELKGHPYFTGVQFHPEFLSHPLSPSPPFFGLVCAASNQLEAYLQSPKCSVEDLTKNAHDGEYFKAGVQMMDNKLTAIAVEENKENMSF